MENRFNNRDFEQFVKQNADQYRMFPSEKVWDNIHNSLHVRKRWYGIGVILLFITIATFTLVMVSHPDKNMPLAQALPKATPHHSTNTKNIQTDDVFIAPSRSSVNRPSDVVSAGKNHPSLFNTTPGTPVETAVQEDMTGDTGADMIYATSASLPSLPPAETQTDNLSTALSARIQHSKQIVAAAIPAKATPINAGTPQLTAAVQHTEEVAAEKKNEEAAKEKPLVPFAGLLHDENRPSRDIVKLNRKNKKLSLQAYITPLISYRDLKENKAFIRAVQTGNITPMSYTPAQDVNNIVTHKPDMGIQLGLAGTYPITKSVSLVGGIQLTVSKYDIKAYTHPSEVTTIALSSAAGGTNTVSTFTNYRNIGGYKADWLRNLYVSAAIPVGLEVKVAQYRKGTVGVTGTVQPTYVIDNRSYLLSTDFKNYAEIPSLIRKVNLNAGFEVFVSNNTGKVKWRLGPQVRYQTMSSFKKKYPVEEHLFDFGLKLGILLR